MATTTDFLWSSAGGAVSILGGVWVRLLNNDTATNYYSTAVTDAVTGSFTHSAPPGDYSLYSGTVATVPGTPNLRSAHYKVPLSSGDDAALKSVTSVASSPYTSTAAAGWVDPIGFGQWGNGIYYPQSSKNPSGAAKGDGVTDDTASITGAITAAKAGLGGARMVFGAGTFPFTSLDFTTGGSVGIFVEGSGLDCPRLTCTATGAGPGIKGGANYFTMYNLAVQYTSASFTGTLVTCGGGFSQNKFEKCLFWGNGVSTAQYLLDISLATTVSVRDCQFNNAQYDILGTKTDGTNQAKGVRLENNYHNAGITTAHIRNPGQAWDIQGDFENLANGKGGVIVMDAPCSAQGVHIHGSWMGDVSDVTAWTYIQVAGSGWTIDGNMMHGATGSTAITVTGATSGLTVTGNMLDNHSVAVALGASLTKEFMISANDLVNTTTPWTGTPNGIGWIMHSGGTPFAMDIWGTAGTRAASIDVSGNLVMNGGVQGGLFSIYGGASFLGAGDLSLTLATNRIKTSQATAPTVGSGGTGVSALSVIAGSTNTALQVQATLTAVAPGVVVGVVTFNGNPLGSAPHQVICSLSAPTAGVAAPPTIGADTFTTNGFTIRSYGPTTVTTGTYIIDCLVIF